jgi:hypothetical protein
MIFRNLIKKWREGDAELIRETTRLYGLPPGSKTAWRSVAFWSVILTLAAVLYLLASAR